jgi:DNA-binding NtrC family response regulator
MPAKILLIETDKALAENLTRLMARKGLRVTAVTEVETAGEALNHEGYDVVIFEEEVAAEGKGRLFRKVKTRHPQAKVILLASCRSDRHPCFEPPFEVFAFLHKPFRWDDLMEKIQEASSHSHP